MEASIKAKGIGLECAAILEGVYFQNKSLQIRYFSTDEKKGNEQSLCLGLGHAHSGPSY